MTPTARMKLLNAAIKSASVCVTEAETRLNEKYAARAAIEKSCHCRLAVGMCEIHSEAWRKADREVWIARDRLFANMALEGRLRMEIRLEEIKDYL